MKKRNLIAIVLVLTIVLALSLSACGLFNTNPTRYYLDIGDVEDASIASVVANNTIASCVRVIVEYYKNGKVVATTASNGFIISEDGYVLTNRHCIVQYENSGKDTPSDASDTPLSAVYSVVFADNLQYSAKLVDFCKEADIGVLKIDPVSEFPLFGKQKTYEPLVFETQQELYYGQKMFTIGNPENLGLMLSQLMVASLPMKFRRTDENKVVKEDSYLSVMLDGNINHGNSGGPLININSRVTGIIYARIDGSGAYGLGCAIPTSEIISFLNGMSVKINYKTTPILSGE